MGIGAGLYVYDVVVKKFTFAISSPDKFLYIRWWEARLGLSDPNELHGSTAVIPSSPWLTVPNANHRSLTVMSTLRAWRYQYSDIYSVVLNNVQKELVAAHQQQL